MAVKIFFCYAREDEALLNKLKSHLRPLQRQGLIDVWHDRNISAGTKWEEEINKHLNEANIVLLLVSPDFMDSDYCYSIEMKRAMERHERKEALVIPIILRPVYWQETSFSILQVLPKDGKPVTTWSNHDKAFLNVVEGIRRSIETYSLITPEEEPKEDTIYLQDSAGGLKELNHAQQLTIQDLEQSKLFQHSRFRRRSLFFVLIGLIIIIGIILTPFIWSSIFFSQHLANVGQSSRQESTLEIPFYAIQSKFSAVPENLIKSTRNDQSSIQIGALYTDGHNSAPLYFLYLNLYNSSSNRFQIVIEEVDLLIQQVHSIPHPTPIKPNSLTTTYNSPYKFEALYLGQENSQLLAFSVNDDFITYNTIHVLLSAHETQPIEIHIISRIEADVVFSLQIIYRFSNEGQEHILLFPNTFEVMFVDKSDWQLV